MGTSADGRLLAVLATAAPVSSSSSARPIPPIRAGRARAVDGTRRAAGPARPDHCELAGQPGSGRAAGLVAMRTKPDGFCLGGVVVLCFWVLLCFSLFFGVFWGGFCWCGLWGGVGVFVLGLLWCCVVVGGCVVKNPPPPPHCLVFVFWWCVCGLLLGGGGRRGRRPGRPGCVLPTRPVDLSWFDPASSSGDRERPS